MIIKENRGMKRKIKSEIAVIIDKTSLNNKKLYKIREILAKLFSEFRIPWTLWISPVYQDVNFLKEYCREKRIEGVNIFICFARLPTMPINISLFTGGAKPVIWVTTNCSCLKQIADIRESIITTGTGYEGMRKAFIVACQIISGYDSEVRLDLSIFLKKMIEQ